jgi:glycosyltransferase involved in cell wall biosynthesis
VSRVVLCVQNLGVPDDPRVWREACTLAGAGHDVTVVAPGSAGATRRERLDGVDVVRYRGVTGAGVVGQLAEVLVGFVGTVRAVARLRRHAPIDVLHVANPPDTLFPLGWWLRRTGTRFVYDQHDAAPELAVAKLGRHALLDRVLRWLERASYRTADLVIASNNASRRRLIADGVASDEVITVRLGPRRADPPSDAPAVPTVVYAGVMGTQDGVEVLIDAFAIVHRRRPGAARIVMIGRGDAEPALRRQVADLGLTEFVTWTGWLPRAEVHQQLRMATVGVSPDLDDPYARLCTMIKVSEYLAAGVPAVVADLPENRVTAGDAARYARPGDAGDLAAALEDVLFDAALRRTLAAAAARRAPALLWDRSASRLLSAYHHLLDGTAPVEGDQHVDDHLVATGS